MSRFAANSFFSLSEFFHSPFLWEEGESVWMALQRLKAYLQAYASYKIEIEIPSDVKIIHPECVAIGEGTILEPGVLIEGPCVLGKGCLIRHGAFLRGGVICGDGCVVGHVSEVKHSIFLNGAQAAHLAYVGDSILGSRVNLGAGVKCANLRLDRREVSIYADGVKVKTGLKKFGAVLGDGCQIGCNVVLNPGTLLGPHCVSYPLLNLQGVIPAHSRMKGKAQEFAIEPIGIEILEALRK